MKKSLVLALVAVLVLSFASMAFAFTDTPDWAKAQIDQLVTLKIVDGSATTFNSTASVTRAEFAKMIVVAKGLSLENPATATFKDVATTNWAFPYVEAAAKAKYIEGYDGKFDPTAKITREQVAKIIVLAAGKTADTTKAINFDDKASISAWATGYVAVAADLKLMQGSNNKFAPKNNTTRAEGAVLVYNELKYEGKVAEVVAADLITYVTTTSIELGGKSINLTSDAEVFLGKQLVSWGAIKKNTHATVTKNNAGNITKIVLNEADYKFVKGPVTDDAISEKFILIGGKKISYKDVSLGNNDDYVYAEYNSDDDAVYDTSAKGVPSGKTVPGKVFPTAVGANEYFVIYDASNVIVYAEKLASSTITNVVDFKAYDSAKKQYYIQFTDGKKYYFELASGHGSDGNAAADYTVNALSKGSTDVTDNTKIKHNDSVDLELNSSNEITKITAKNVSIKGIVTNVQYVADSAVDNYKWIISLNKISSDLLSGTTVTLVSKDFVKATDFTASTLGDFSVFGGVYAPTAANANNVYDVKSDGRFYVGANTVNPWEVKLNDYLEVSLNDDATQKVTKVAAYETYALGLVDSIEKANDKVTTVTISGKKYNYVGKADKYLATSTKGYVVVDGASAEIKAGQFGYAVLDSNGAIKLFTFLGKMDDTTYANDILTNATVVAVKNTNSRFINSSTDYTQLTVPKNIIEVALTVNNVTRYAWVTYNDDMSAASASNPFTITNVDFDTIKVGDSISLKVPAAATINAGSTFFGGIKENVSGVTKNATDYTVTATAVAPAVTGGPYTITPFVAEYLFK